ncbi:MAG: PQQ-dependent sugar dehydrogenase [Planctomycetes bacterium]|nr:PQQ-dependent sugar dehydrogenase [Planctomycetota bacterium]
MRYFVVLAAMAALLAACGKSDASHQVTGPVGGAPAASQDPVVDRRSPVEILQQERGADEIVALLPCPIVQEHLAPALAEAKVPVEALRKPDFVRYQFYTNNLVQLIRRQRAGSLWVALDDSDPELVAYVDQFFFARHKVMARYAVDKLLLVHVANQMSGGGGGGVDLVEVQVKPGGFVTGMAFDASGRELWYIVKNGVLSCVEMDGLEVRGDQKVFTLPSLQKGKEGVYTGGESGLVGLALHPGFTDNRRLFLHYNYKREDQSKQAVVEEFVLAGRLGNYTVQSRRVLLRIDQPNDDHNSGVLMFGPDHMLYLGVGDGLVGKWTIGRAPAELLRGKILRIDVDRRDEGKEYAVPPDNPFVGDKVVPPETWAWGFRNPWRMHFLPDGRLVAGDIGEDVNEEVTFVVRGRHHGWPYWEGAYARNPWGLEGVEPVTPFVAYEREVGNSVICGPLYLGEIESLRGKLIVADHLTGRIWAIDVPPPDAPAGAPLSGADLHEIGRWPQLFTTFAEAPDHTLYVGAANQILRLAPGTGRPTSAGDDVQPLSDDVARGMFGQDVPSPTRPAIREGEVALGRLLYESTALSSDGKQSCASCHPLDRYGQDGRVVAVDVGGKKVQRNTSSTFNASRQFAQFADYRADSVEAGALEMLRGVQGLGDAAAIEAAVVEVPGAVEAMARVYGGNSPVTAANVGLALGAFLRQLSTQSRWERYLGGADDALTADEKLGLSLFVSQGCISCHQYATLGGGMPQKLGLMQAWTGTDRGRVEVSGVDSDAWFFKVPVLLNVAQTAPYYHDGSMATLEAAIRHMAKVQLARDLTERQVALIAGFLASATGEPPVIR